MAPDYRNETTLTTPSYYTVSTADSTATPTRISYSDTSTTWITYEIVSKPTAELVKKLLKRMANEMCKVGWIRHFDYYSEPRLMPINLRGVRFDGRGWANKK